jgi:hypothetical protein
VLNDFLDNDSWLFEICITYKIYINFKKQVYNLKKDTIQLNNLPIEDFNDWTEYETKLELICDR